ncbi:sensor domain-containing protein [Mycolicibacterium pulveris]|nr:sensor domain-containing protein [Mycolicibacterium pulveris]MCV6983122.1 sensor domain-containing protein [Mycolicibacterium pulveris]
MGAVVVAATVPLSGCVSTVSGTAVRGPDLGQFDVPPLDETKLNDVLLSIGELNGIMGSTTMRVTSELDEMTDHSDDVSDRDCLGTVYGAEEPVYDGSGWTHVRDEVAREPGDDNAHWVEQTAVLYPSPRNAQRFFDDSRRAWQNCAGTPVAIFSDDEAYFWDLDDVLTEDALITQMTTQDDADGWACQHALAVASNLTVETWACGYTIIDEAETIAREMLANAARR